IRQAFGSRQRSLRGRHDADDAQYRLVIPAASVEELHALLPLAKALTIYTGGSAWPRYDPHGIVFDVRHASKEELQEIWNRVTAGEAPGMAFSTVKGPSYRLRERLGREARPGRRKSSSNETIEVRHRETGGLLHRVAGNT